jgi:hypothetical protein
MSSEQCGSDLNRSPSSNSGYTDYEFIEEDIEIVVPIVLPALIPVPTENVVPTENEMMTPEQKLSKMKFQKICLGKHLNPLSVFLHHKARVDPSMSNDKIKTSLGTFLRQKEIEEAIAYGSGVPNATRSFSNLRNYSWGEQIKHE